MKKHNNLTLISVAVSMALSATVTSANDDHEGHRNSGVKHVLLISVDGLHQSDVDWFVKKNPNSTLATLANNGIRYTHALTPFPSEKEYTEA